MYKYLKSVCQYILIPFRKKFRKYIYNALINDEYYIYYLLQLYIYRDISEDEKATLINDIIHHIGKYPKLYFCQDKDDIYCLPKSFLYYIIWKCHKYKYTQTYVSYLFPELTTIIDYSYINACRFIEEFMEYMAIRLSNLSIIPVEEISKNIDKLLWTYRDSLQTVITHN